MVADLSEVEKLASLPFLRALVLAECPMCEGEEYRVEVLVRLRRLERLDKDEFSEDERGDAEEVGALLHDYTPGVVVLYCETCYCMFCLSGVPAETTTGGRGGGGLLASSQHFYSAHIQYH